MRLYKDPNVLFRREHWDNLYISWIPFAGSFRYIKFNEQKGEIKGTLSQTVRNYDDFIIVDRKILKENKQSKENDMSMGKNYVGKFKVVSVAFLYLDKDYEAGKKEPTHIYYYKIDPSMNVKKGDPVIVDGTSDYKVAVVHKAFNDDFSKETIEAKNRANKWIISRVDDTLHRKRMAATERSIFLKSEMERLKDEYNEMQLLEAIAQNNPEAKKMLDEIKKIENIEGE